MTTWADRIRQRLAELPGKNQTGLARACGISQPSVSEWLSGQSRRIYGDNLVAAAKYLRTTPEWIMTGRGGHLPEHAVHEAAATYDVASPELIAPERLTRAIDIAQRAFAKAGQIPNASALAAGIILAFRQMDAGDGKAAIIATVAERLREIGGSQGGTINNT